LVFVVTFSIFCFYTNYQNLACLGKKRFQYALLLVNDIEPDKTNNKLLQICKNSVVGRFSLPTVGVAALRLRFPGSRSAQAEKNFWGPSDAKGGGWNSRPHPI